MAMAMSIAEKKMGQAEFKNIVCFAEYLANVGIVNFFITLERNCVVDTSDKPRLSIISNHITIPSLGNFIIVLDEIDLEDCSDMPPFYMDKNVMCYRLEVKAESGNSSTLFPEMCSNYERVVGKVVNNLIRNSLNTVALMEGFFYNLKCRACSKFLTTNKIRFDRILPLPPKNWVENAHDLWFKHRGEASNYFGAQQDKPGNLSDTDSEFRKDKSNDNSNNSTEFLNNPDIKHCFYGPCNWAFNKNLADGICENDAVDSIRRADCMHCGKELGSFTSDHCVKIWDYGIEWVNEAKANHSVSNTTTAENNTETETRAFQNFKSIVFATIHELKDLISFRFSVSSVNKGNSLFLWNIDTNLVVYHQKVVESNSTETYRLERSKVAKFFYAVRENNLLKNGEDWESQFIRESEQNNRNMIVIPDFVYRVGLDNLKKTSAMYSRDVEMILQTGHLSYDQ